MQDSGSPFSFLCFSPSLRLPILLAARLPIPPPKTRLTSPSSTRGVGAGPAGVSFLLVV